jgi:excinuclease ABC subunit C
MIPQRVLTKLNTLPAKPGVYLMKDMQAHVIYVGKAKDLSSRVSQYFLRPQAGKVHAMVMHVDDFDTIITQTEKEAFILEMNLIHQHYPRYNIMLKEGSHYPYIALRKGPDPYLKIMRHNRDQHYRYFGPYPNSRSAYRIIQLLNKIFPLRKCNVLPKAACLYFHIGQCLAPCINTIQPEVYNDLASQIDQFLKGHVQDKVKFYQDKMEAASEALNFEMAQEYKVILEDIAHISDKQNVEIYDQTARDIIAFATREGYLALTIFVIRDGRLLGKGSYVVEQFDDIEDQLVTLIAQYYEQKPRPEVMTINSLTLASRIETLLDLKTSTVEKGTLFSLMDMAQTNAMQTLDDHFLTARLDDDKIALLETLGKLIHTAVPYHIDMFDNSHLQGSHGVGAMVSFINGEGVKKLYRQFHLSEASQQSDVAGIEEIISRKYLRAQNNQEKLPDLIIVDGGTPQVLAAEAALKKLTLTIPVVGLFKNDKHQTKGVVLADGEVIDFTKYPPVFFFLVRMQDEVHRYAISFHRRIRGKAMTKSIFDDIPGLGAARRALLEKRYNNIDILKQATLLELGQILPLEVASLLFEKIQKLKT